MDADYPGAIAEIRELAELCEPSDDHICPTEILDILEKYGAR
jgi:hypothetical protein